MPLPYAIVTYYSHLLWGGEAALLRGKGEATAWWNYRRMGLLIAPLLRLEVNGHGDSLPGMHIILEPYAPCAGIGRERE